MCYKVSYTLVQWDMYFVFCNDSGVTGGLRVSGETYQFSLEHWETRRTHLEVLACGCSKASELPVDFFMRVL
jgi:hypothetical protein